MKRSHNYIDLSTRVGRNSFYNTPEWNAMRGFILTKQPYCVECLKKDIYTLSTEVDHIIDIKLRPDLCLSAENLQGLCKRCHSKKTFSENNKTFGKKNIYKQVNMKWPKLGID
jgi:5-methylcytosine-specific restriction endonuclease McrA